MKRNYFLLLFLTCCCFLRLGFAYDINPIKYKCNQTSQYLYWTGEEDSDFFNENNWRITNQKPSKPEDKPGKPYCLPGANKEDYQICLGDIDLNKDKHPKEGSIDPGNPIKYNLYAAHGNLVAEGTILFGCDTNGLTLSGSELSVKNQWANGVLTADAGSTVFIETEVQSFDSFRLNLIDAESWIYFKDNNPIVLEQNALNSIFVNDVVGVLNENFKLDQYYQSGTILRKKDLNYAPLTIYDGTGLTNDSGSVKEFQIYKGQDIPEGLDNATSSFILKRGYQATFAVKENGTSMSKVYIASEEDLVIDNLPAALENNISFIRAMPWEWIVKKGTGGYFNDLNAGWYYNWGNGSDTEANYKYVPMTWGAGAATASGVAYLNSKKNVNQVLAFNESDNCNDQSGQYNNLCEPAVAVAYYENLMGTGLRLGTPAPRENGPFGWLSEFNEIAKARNVRFDFVAVHWYDWGSNPANTPNAPASAIFNRFKNYLERVHQKYNLPIWITEFNANPNRGNATQEAFLQLALPYLEGLDYVERYAYFQPNGGAANYKDEVGNLTNIGELYLHHQSTPSIPELSYPAPNNLEGLDMPFEEKEPIVLALEAECSPLLGSQLVPVAEERASNGYYLQLDTEREGASILAKQVHFELNVTTADSYRVWVRYKSSMATNTAIDVYVDDSDEAERLGGLKNPDFGWEQLPRFFDLAPGKHRITIEIPSDGFLFDAVALINDSDVVDIIPQATETCTPPDTRWGAMQTDVTYFKEAEEANPLGSNWSVGSSAKAGNGGFIQSSSSSTDMPPSDAGYAVFNFDVAENDRYEIWGKVQALNDNTDAFWVKVDDGDFQKWDNLKSEIYLWYWKRVHTSIGNEDRNLSYFMEAGNHQIIIAYNEANTKIDRVAVSSFNKSPSEEDPNVLFPNSNIEYEAEDAIFVNNTLLQNCASASNGQLVAPKPFNGNRIRFEGIGVPQAGTYTLQISYISANERNFGIRVNGMNLGNRPIPSSGEWCFNGGAPAIYEMEVQLEAGENVVEFTGAFNDAPFFDKIAFIQNTGYEMEAENAELTGGSAVQHCDAASNGQYVNTKAFADNSIIFNDIVADAAGTYSLKIDYLTAVTRSLVVQINDGEELLTAFEDSGEWCFNGGTPATLSLSIDLNAGLNTIRLKNTGSLGPFIDRISLVKSAQQASSRISIKSNEALSIAEKALNPGSLESDFHLYPNPVQNSEPIYVILPKNLGRNLTIEIMDIRGKMLFSKVEKGINADRMALEYPNLGSGIYFVSFSDGTNKAVKRLLIR